MIVRLVVVDPRPRDPQRDVVVYQVPERSRELELLVESFEALGIQCVTVESPRTRKPRSQKT